MDTLINQLNDVCRLMDQNKYEAALSLIKDNNDGDSLWHKCLCRLHLGDISGLDLYFTRIGRATSDSPHFPPFPISFWNGNLNSIPINAQKVLILNEQGFGDELMFLPPIIEFINENKNVDFILQLYPEIAPLIENNIIRVFPYNNVKIITQRSFKYSEISLIDYFTSTGSIFSYITRLDKKFKKLNNLVGYSKFKKLVENKNIINLTTNKLSSNTNKRMVTFNEIKDKLPNDEEYIRFEDIEVTNFWNTLGIVQNANHVYTVDTALANLCLFYSVPFTLIHKSNFLDWRMKFNIKDLNRIIIND